MNGSSDEAEVAPVLDIHASHIAREWKYTAPLLGCRFDPSGRYLFASSMDFSIHRWDLQDDAHTTFVGHHSWLRGIGFSPDGRTMFSADYQGRLCFWDALANPGKPIAPQRTVEEAHQGWIRCLAVHPSGDIVATAGNDLQVRLWSTHSGETVKTLSGHEKHIYSLMFHPAGESLLSGDLAGVVQQWDLNAGKSMRTLDAKPLHTYHGGQQVDYGGVRCMSLSGDGSELACGGLHKATNPFAGVQEPLVLIFDWQSGKQIRTHEATEIPRGIVWRLIHEPDGTLTSGVGGQQGYLVFWGTEKTEIHKLKLPDPVLDLDRHPHVPEVATASHDGKLRVIRMSAKV